MARDFRTESEFGLPVLPDPFGVPIPDDAVGAKRITGLTDAEAIKAGAGAEDGNQLFTNGAQLREIYAQGEGTLGPQEPKAGTSTP